jgi:hypothetical protein
MLALADQLVYENDRIMEEKNNKDLGKTKHERAFDTCDIGLGLLFLTYKYFGSAYICVYTHLIKIT